MASSASIPATSAAAAAKASSAPTSQRRLPQSTVTLRPSLRRTNLAFSAASPAAQVSVDGSATPSKSEIPKPKVKDESAKQEVSSLPVSDSSISEFMTEVASLIKLVDSRDIVELQLKQLDCELVIRKKEALPQPLTPAPMIMAQPPALQAVAPSQLPSAAPSRPAPAPAPAPPAKPTRSSHPPLKCPMAGTFYRSPAPGEPAFVKIGDKVKKGQVLCIIEAMKLMNEIEADQSGTVVDILVDDGKPVSADTPLFVIEP
ncbi:biotin carboxyl carrier protein of acetyl-CoA carboxylase 1, chloroplastic-like isoform X2 [Nymphaea colorata]|uniref:biotin carboxyl carrier protein of acetyl-CoA carboxylase 1, chloroplastic-like isoform X2 n=1 Tax=Nymphaea colorata TaxID=210225 RepID=UPI00129DBBB4|nr:biotin carboxyl carrier protein of acetyl-CoA carboxylase 1, chloroplastic-like isoform X2 [Nymphaea colorata]